jgi:hypothetical protein
VRDEWTKNPPDEWTVINTTEFLPENGGVTTAHVSELVRTRSVPVPMTQEEVEAHLKNLQDASSYRPNTLRLI